MASRLISSFSRIWIFTRLQVGALTAANFVHGAYRGVRNTPQGEWRWRGKILVDVKTEERKEKPVTAVRFSRASAVVPTGRMQNCSNPIRHHRTSHSSHAQWKVTIWPISNYRSKVTRRNQRGKSSQSTAATLSNCSISARVPDCWCCDIINCENRWIFLTWKISHLHYTLHFKIIKYKKIKKLKNIKN